MNENYSVTYSYYTKDGRRLAVFCRYLDEQTAELFTLACSKKDQFNRKYAKSVYKGFMISNQHAGFYGLNNFHPVIEKVQIKPEEGTLQTLLKYCKEHYYFPIEVPVAAKDKIVYMAAKEYEKEYKPVRSKISRPYFFATL